MGKHELDEWIKPTSPTLRTASNVFFAIIALAILMAMLYGLFGGWAPS